MRIGLEDFEEHLGYLEHFGMFDCQVHGHGRGSYPVAVATASSSSPIMQLTGAFPLTWRGIDGSKDHSRSACSGSAKSM